MKNITFYEQINIFLENKGHGNPRPTYAYTRMCKYSEPCIHRHRSTYIARVLETYERQVFYINVKVWNDSHIVWEPFQTSIFSLYKAIHDTFSKHTENPKGKPKIH